MLYFYNAKDTLSRFWYKKSMKLGHTDIDAQGYYFELRIHSYTSWKTPNRNGSNHGIRYSIYHRNVVVTLI
jgi:hypothetical protein